MKRKELMKRALALTLSAAMAVGNIPAMAYASEVVENEDGGVLQTVEVSSSEDEAENENASEDLEVQQAEPGQDEIIQVEGDIQLEEPVEIDNSVDEDTSVGMQMADQGIQVQSDEATATDENDDAKAAAVAYLKENFIDGTNKVITTGGDGVVKSTDGLTYTIGLTTPSGGSISSLRLKYLNTVYKTGWYIDENNPYIGYKAPATNGSRSISRPATDYSFTATLKLFAKDTETTDINDGTATALATQDFTFILKAKAPEYRMTITAKDKKTGEVIKNPKITLTSQSSWNEVSPENGSYKVEDKVTYTLKVTADGYKDYSNPNFTFVGDPSNLTPDQIVELEPLILRTISFNVTDVNGNPIDAKITLKKDWATSIVPENGNYKLEDGTEYTYTIEATNYKTVTGNITPSEDQTIDIKMEKDISSYKVIFQPMDGNTTISGATVKVEEYGEDDDGYDDWFPVIAVNGVYTLEKNGEYRYSVKADGYKDISNVSYVPTGDNEEITVPISMDKDVQVDPADQATVDKVKEIYDAEIGALRSSYSYSNLNTLVEAKLKTGKYADVKNADQVKVSVVSADASDWIETDGTIHYSTADTFNSGVNSKNVSVVLKFSLNGATAVAEVRTVIVGWDLVHFASKMQDESKELTWDKIKGTNISQEDVTSNLTLSQCMGTSLREVWSTITWESSNPSVINIQKPDIDSPIYAATGTVNPSSKDEEVTLTATFTANDTVMNSQVEKPEDIEPIEVSFKVIVKGTGVAKPTEDELNAILDKYYTISDLTDAVTKKPIDPSACTGDIQLLRYTKVKDENGDPVFNNKEITVTSDNNAIKINGYMAKVDVFQNEDVTVNLTVSFTREGVTVQKVFPITIKKLTQEDLNKEVEMMEYAKAHYFDGIKGDNISEEQITENLHAFQEMYFDEDGKAVWVYHVDDMKNKGIIPDGYFDDPWQMEGAGYNKFKSSNNAVIQHENLVVIRPETPTEITITSWLSSERYGKYAVNHPDNETLQKLFKQEVSATVTVQPDIKAVDQLQTAITNAKELLGSVTEGNGAGQYPAGTREKLQAAIENAETIIGSETATSDEMSKAAADLANLVKEIQASQKTVEATVTAKINTVAGAGMDVSKMAVKADTAENYGYTKPESCKNKVTALDVLVAWHAATYGDKFKNDPTQYLVISGGFISRIYGIDTYDVGILVNNKVPGSSTVDVATMVTGDSVTFFRYSDTKTYQDLYLYFEGMPETVKVNEAINLTLYGSHPMKFDAEGNPEAASVKKGFTVAALDAMGRQVATGVTDENGAVTLQINTAGTYQITVLGTAEDYHETAMIVPQETIVVTGTSDIPAAHVHSFGAWRTVSAATVFAAEKQERICACGEKETRTVGTPLKATIKVNMSSVPLKVKQTTTKLKVSGLANGDAVVSYTSSNRKVFTVDKNGKIKAGKKKGSAKLTITLKSGLKKTITVKVQKTTVKTKKIQGLQKTITLKKGTKTTLKPILNPLTSQQKIKYTSSRKKVATVSSRGVIKAKKAGKTTITVKSGSKKYKITVNVKQS